MLELMKVLESLVALLIEPRHDPPLHSLRHDQRLLLARPLGEAKTDPTHERSPDSVIDLEQPIPVLVHEVTAPEPRQRVDPGRNVGWGQEAERWRPQGPRSSLGPGILKVDTQANPVLAKHTRAKLRAEPRHFVPSGPACPKPSLQLTQTLIRHAGRLAIRRPTSPSRAPTRSRRPSLPGSVHESHTTASHSTSTPRGIRARNRLGVEEVRQLVAVAVAELVARAEGVEAVDHGLADVALEEGLALAPRRQEQG